MEKLIASADEGKKPFTCNIKIISNEDRIHHIKSIHEGKTAFECVVCFATFNYKHGLKNYLVFWLWKQYGCQSIRSQEKGSGSW